MIRALPALAVALAACSPADSDECAIATSSAEVRAADRKLLGSGYAFPADATLRGQEAALRGSQRLRREAAWRTVAKVLTPVPLAHALPSAPAAQVPGWQTWYGGDDVRRLFQRLYDGLGSDGRNARARFGASAVDDAFAWNTTSVEELATWPEERWTQYLASLDTAAKVSGIGGVAPVLYSAPVVRHLLRSYPELVRCEADGAPGAFVDTPGDAAQVMARESVGLAACGQRVFGPFFVSDGATLRATVAGGDVAGATIEIVRASAVIASCDAHAPCTVTGAGTYHVAVRSGGNAVSTTMTVDYFEPRAAWAPCLASAFPLDAVVVKASWQRANAGIPLPAFDTSPARIAALAAADAPDWGSGDDEVDPGADSIYTMQLENGNVYRLAALHIMTKELDHWSWTTLWWSRDPDTDFGADRPAAIGALGGVWSNYKMCTVTSFDEGDPDPAGGYAESAPSLAAALAATHAGVGGPSWCSNPYLELGAGNAATNCMGCHQHGGTGTTPETILGDGSAFPAHGRTLLRNNFPSDYSYAVDAGDRVGNMFSEVVDYYDGFE